VENADEDYNNFIKYILLQLTHITSHAIMMSAYLFFIFRSF